MNKEIEIQDTNQEFKSVIDCLLDVINTTGLIAKKDLLRGHGLTEEMKFALTLAFDPFLITGMAKKKLTKEVKMPVNNSEPSRKSLLNVSKESTGLVNIPISFRNLVEYFDSNNTGKDIDILNIQNFISRSIRANSLSLDETKVLESIITKSLTLGLNTKSINEVFDNLIPTFGCQLGVKLEGVEDYLEGKFITVTEKLDGNRCICIKGDDIFFFSRNGKPIDGLDSIKTTMSKLPKGVYDGEILADDFNSTQSTMRTKGTKEGLVYCIFDYCDNIDEFFDVEQNEISGPYCVRRDHLEDFFNQYGDGTYVTGFTNVKKVPVLYSGVYDSETVMKYHDQIKAQGGEGVMINVDTASYIKDRTKNLVKVKAMKSCDIPCVGIESGDGRLANTLGFIICKYKGYEVKVGSGFDDATRAHYYRHPEDIVNHLVEVQYFEETTNQDGTVSLRFPVFLRVRTDKEEESYE